MAANQAGNNVRTNRWLLTYNNPIFTAEDLIYAFDMHNFKYVFQKERGVEGTEHFQIYLQTDRIYARQLIQIFTEHIGFHPHVQAARR
jgi:hypothetical protein